MKWLRWLPRLLTESVPDTKPTGNSARIPTPATAERLGIRDVGHCEVCGRPMQARTRREEYRGRVDCDCGYRNHVEYRDVRIAGTVRRKHVTVTTSRRFEAARHKPDLRLAWRYGVCPSCSTAVRLLDAHIVAHEDATGSVETISYYCTNCRLDDDSRRGRLVGHDGPPVTDELRYPIRADTAERE
jgi:hypothetical protein